VHEVDTLAPAPEPQPDGLPTVVSAAGSDYVPATALDRKIADCIREITVASCTLPCVLPIYATCTHTQPHSRCPVVKTHRETQVRKNSAPVSKGARPGRAATTPADRPPSFPSSVQVAAAFKSARSAFDEFDADKSGSIDKSEMTAAVAKVRQPLCPLFCSPLRLLLLQHHSDTDC
jgi:hypothetical protein